MKFRKYVNLVATVECIATLESGVDENNSTTSFILKEEKPFEGSVSLSTAVNWCHCSLEILSRESILGSGYYPSPTVTGVVSIGD